MSLVGSWVGSASASLNKTTCLEEPYFCALHDVSPRDRWLCVLPGWQMKRERKRRIGYAKLRGREKAQK